MIKLKVGIIGSGFGLYGLLPAFNSLKNCKVTAICGKKTERLINYCQKINLKNIYTNWQEMLIKEKLDAIAIAVTPDAQYSIAKEAITKGIHVFLEKPITLNLLQAKELNDLAQKNKVTHAVDFIFPEINTWKKVKKIIDNQKYGKLKHISVNWNFCSYNIKNSISSWKNDITKGGGVLSFYFSHSLYYLEYFAGRIIQVQNLGETNTGIDLIFKFENNTHGYGHIRCDTIGMNRHLLTLQFEKATILLEAINSTTNFSIKIQTENKIKKLKTSITNINKKDDERIKEVKKIAKRFIIGCLEKKQIKPSIIEGLRVQKLIANIRENSSTSNIILN